jgi:hydrogenase maturation factor HypE
VAPEESRLGSKLRDSGKAVETKNDLVEAKSSMKRQAIDAAQKNIENMKEQLAEAEEEADEGRAGASAGPSAVAAQGRDALLAP